jgi:hypothetical protein
MLNLTGSVAVLAPSAVGPEPMGKVSPLLIADRLITLAQDADRAGYSTTAERLVRLVNRVFDEERRLAHG